ncbi:hypothetical protein KY345_02735 [Candidatus Woesearchaeota archaeon]|nr:hypothetical protein [Candidatus Woesearchaeota archaeon]
MNDPSKKELIKKAIKLGNKLDRKPKKRDSSNLNYYARKLFGSWNNLMLAAGYNVRCHQNIRYPKLNKKFAYFLGLLVTDGHIQYDESNKKYKVAIYTSYIQEKDLIIKLIKDLFNYNAGISSRIYGFNKKPNYEIRISSKKLANILINRFNIPAGNKSLSIVFPKIIKNGGKEIKKSFLRGIIDGDGSISNKTIKIASGSIRFLEDVKDSLSQLNISCGRIIKDNKLTSTFSIRINRYNDLLKVKEIYVCDVCYKRKKDIIDKI